MTDYTKQTDFAAKDALTHLDPNKTARGAEVDAELGLIQTAINSKENKSAKFQAGGYAGLDANGNLPLAGKKVTGGAQATASGETPIYETTTVTATVVGISGQTTVDLRFARMGNTVFCRYELISGIANTGLSAGASNSAIAVTGAVPAGWRPTRVNVFPTFMFLAGAQFICEVQVQTNGSIFFFPRQIAGGTAPPTSVTGCSVTAYNVVWDTL